jgi:nucleotide-binding universal stress UspA family protein
MVPIDESGRGQTALGTARDLALRLGAGVRLMTVHGNAARADVITSMLEDLAGRISEVPTEVEVLVAKDPAAAIVEAAGDAVVCMTTAASLLPHEGHFGSIAEEVVRNSSRPVVLIGPKAEPSLTRTLSRIIVPVDGSPRSEEALGPAGVLSTLLGLPVWIVTVVARADERAFVAEVGRGAVAAESGYVRLLARTLSREHGVEGEFDVLHGENPADSILEYARPDGVVVMTTHGRSGLARLFAGSTATSVVARSEHPVFVVHTGDGTDAA